MRAVAGVAAGVAAGVVRTSWHESERLPWERRVGCRVAQNATTPDRSHGGGADRWGVRQAAEHLYGLVLSTSFVLRSTALWLTGPWQPVAQGPGPSGHLARFSRGREWQPGSRIHSTN
jgi:hypothetical protein